MDTLLLAGMAKRQRLLVRRQYVEDTLGRWDAWEKGGRGNSEPHRPGQPAVAPMPALTRAALSQLRVLICEELARLDERSVPDIPRALGALGAPGDQARPRRYPTPETEASDFGPE